MNLVPYFGINICFSISVISVKACVHEQFSLYSFDFQSLDLSICFPNISHSAYCFRKKNIKKCQYTGFLIVNMANISIISMDELSTSLESVDWKICFICQQSGKYDVQDPMAKKGESSNHNNKNWEEWLLLLLKNSPIWKLIVKVTWLKSEPNKPLSRMQVQKADNKLKQKASSLVYFIINKVLLKSYYIILLGFDPTKCSYQTTALYLKEFEQTNALPPQLKRRCAMYKDDKDLSEAFIENHALFHKSCVSTYNKQKLSL